MKAVLLDRPHSGRTWLQSTLRLRRTCVPGVSSVRAWHVGKPSAAFLTRERSRLLQVVLQPRQVLPMCRRNVFQVEERNAVGGRIELAGEKMRIRGNLDASLG